MSFRIQSEKTYHSRYIKQKIFNTGIVYKSTARAEVINREENRVNVL